MRGEISLELYNPLTGEIEEEVHVKNIIMDNVLRYLAGSSDLSGAMKIVLGTGFNDDELRTDLNTLIHTIYTSPDLARVYSTGDKFFTVSVEIDPTQANGDLIEIGILQGKLYNRAIFKRLGSIADSTLVSYKIVGGLGSLRSAATIASSATTGSSSNQNSIKLTWNSNGISDAYYVFKSINSGPYKLLATTQKTFLYDDGFIPQGSVSVPSPIGTVPAPTSLAVITLTDPVPYIVTKTEDFAARALIKINFDRS